MVERHYMSNQSDSPRRVDSDSGLNEKYGKTKMRIGKKKKWLNYNSKVIEERMAIR